MDQMKVVILHNEEEVDTYVADHIINVIKSKNKPVIGFATGSTPLGCYDNLISGYKNGEVDFSNTIAFNLDEYVGIAKEDSRSFANFMRNYLFSKVNIKNENIYSLNGECENLKRECLNYEELTRKYPIDIQILGVGMNGHIGYNEPNSSFDGETHVVDLEIKSIESSLDYGFEEIDDVPVKGITMGIGTIMRAKQLVMVVKGKKKAEVVKEMLQGKVREEFPSTIIRRHSNVIVVLDKAAASNLTGVFR